MRCSRLVEVLSLIVHNADTRKAVQAFNPYDLYSKSDEPPRVDELKGYYMQLINEYFPDPVIRW